MKEISIIIPIYNSEFTITKLIDAINNELKNIVFEVILINDGSKDDSARICSNLSLKFTNIRFINLRKNFGEFNAVMCGLNYVSGKYAVIIDDDLQNHPSEILKLYAKAKAGEFDVVYSQYQSKKHSLFRNFGSEIVNYFTTFLLKKPKNLYLSSFKIIKKEVVEEIIKYKGPNPYIDALIFRITDNIETEIVTHSERLNGDSNYSFKKLISLFLTVLFGYSVLPLRLAFLAGFFSIIISLIYMLLHIFEVINHGGAPLIIFMCGCILCSIALLGEYVGNSLLHLTGKPQYVIKSDSKKDQ